jgi:hypothetical protein
MMGSAGGSDCEMVGVFPNSSLETPASEDVGIIVQRHERSYVGKIEHGGDWTRLDCGCPHCLGDFIDVGNGLPRHRLCLTACAV